MKRRTQRSLVIYLLMILVALAILNIYFLTFLPQQPQTLKEFEEAAKKATPAVVSIVADEKGGSGSIISSNGYILTNYHVISETQNISVKLPDKRIFPAELIGVDPAADIALLKINETSLPSIKIGDSDKVEIGEKVLAIGNPFGFDFTVTTGIISAEHRDRGPTEYRDFLQTDASINPGNSGGPLVNLKGELIGINTFIISDVRTGELGFAIPSNLAKKIMDQLIKYGKVSRGYFGIRVKDIVDINEEGTGRILSGALITSVEENGPADKAGLLQDDFIIEVNNIKTESINQLRNQIAWLSPGQIVNVKVIRNETEINFELKVDLRPN